MGALASILLLVGLAVLYAAQRIFSGGDAETLHQALLWVGIGLVTGSALWRGMQLTGRSGTAKGAELRLLVAHGGVLFALGLYSLTTDWGVALLGGDPEAKGATILAVLWPAAFLVSGLALLFMELAYRRMPVADAIELRRIASAARDGMTIALALIFVVSVNYTAVKKDVRKDVSYFKTTMPSDSTLRMVKSLNEPIRAVLLFPKTNEVLKQVEPYFDRLAAASSKFSVEVKDHALAPELAQKHKVRDNGYVVLLKGTAPHEQAEQIQVGTELTAARTRLKSFDGHFQQNFTSLARQKREVHFTVGHGERSDTSFKDTPEGTGTTELASALRRANVTMKNLGISQGLANEVPEGAPAVLVVGPRTPFLPEENGALERYIRAGGRVVIMVDPQDDHGLSPLLESFHLSLLKGTLASETNHTRRTFTPADRGLVFTKRYSSHPTVTLASRHQNELATVFVHGGAVSKTELEGDGGGAIQFPIRSGHGFWLDLDGNFERGPEEPLTNANMMAVVTVPVPGNAADGSKKEGRLVVIADGDFVTDQVIRNPGNSFVLNDILKWMLGEEEIVSVAASEEDIPIEHTREEDKVWFYATTVGVPLIPLAFGIAVALRRRRKPKKRKTTKPSNPEEVKS